MSEWLDDPQLLSTFKAEAGERIESLSRGLLRLETQPNNPEVVAEIFRDAHTLKGSAGMMGFDDLKELAHAIEDVLGELRSGLREASGELIDVLLASVDSFKEVLSKSLVGERASGELERIIPRLKGEPVETLPLADEAGSEPDDCDNTLSGLFGEKDRRKEPAESGPSATPQEIGDPFLGRTDEGGHGHETAQESTLEAGVHAEAPSSSRKGPHLEESIRVNLGKFDSLLNLVGEAVISQSKTEQHIRDLIFLATDSKDAELSAERVKRLIKNPSWEERGKDALVDEVLLLCNSVGRINDTLLHRTNEFGKLLGETALITHELQESAMSVRMLPIGTVLAPLSRVVRDLCRQQGKEAQLVLVGEGTELDKRVMEQLADPLLHLVRNAVDHGIEAPSERRSCGKPSVGTVSISTYQQGNQIVIEVKDDGKGIDPQTVKEVAVRRGLIDDPDNFPDDQAIYLLFRSGFSTSRLITDVSGRGVGLDVVKTNVEKLQGHLQIESEPGEWTRFVVTLPVTLAIFPALLVRAGEQKFAIPLAAVEEAVVVAPEDISTVEGKEAITVRGSTLPLARLSEILDIADDDHMERRPVVITSTVSRRMGFVVSELIGQQEVVIKTLGDFVSRVRKVAGATILGSGDVVLVLDVGDLVQAARERHRPSAGQAAPRRRDQASILVAEDSLTIRELERTILQTAGYDVEVAPDGLEAAGKIGSKDFDLVVTDVEMPGMDGFSLCRHIRENERSKDIPVIILTSRASDDDKRRGIEVGADAYLVKSAFDQGNLLDTISRLIG